MKRQRVVLDKPPITELSPASRALLESQHWTRVNDLQHLTREASPHCGDVVRTACGQWGTVARASANLPACWLCRSLRARGRA